MSRLERDGDTAATVASELRSLLPAAAFGDGECLELAACLHVRRFSGDEVVYHRGDPAGHLFLIRDGLVKVLLEHESGREAIIGLLGRGEFFGELVLFESTPRESTIRAVTATAVLQIPAACFLRVIERQPLARELMFKRLAATIHHVSGLLETQLFLDVRGRLATYLLALRGEAPLTQDDIAAAIGSTRVTVNKALADLERRGLIAVERKNVRVLDAAKLAKEVRF